MNSMTDYLKNKVLTEKLQNVFVALFNEENEISKSSYLRQSVVFTEAENGQTTNNADILFPIAQENWGNITYVGIYDSEADGNLLFKSSADVIKNIEISSQYKIPKNYLIIRLR